MATKYYVRRFARQSASDLDAAMANKDIATTDNFDQAKNDLVRYMRNEAEWLRTVDLKDRAIAILQQAVDVNAWTDADFGDLDYSIKAVDVDGIAFSIVRVRD